LAEWLLEGERGKGGEGRKRGNTPAEEEGDGFELAIATMGASK